MAKRIGDKFTKAANDNAAPSFDGIRPGAVYITVGLYNAYLAQYDLSQRFARHLDDVMANVDHERIMEEGRVLRYDLPDEEEFTAELRCYRHYLDSFDPRNNVMLKGDRVRVPVDMARRLHYMGAYNAEFSRHVLMSVLRTEYLRRFGDLKRKGIPYDGPTALQEAVDVLVSCERTAREEQRAGRLVNWPRPEM